MRIAVVGLGRSGLRIHCRQLARLPEQYHIAAVVDGLEERRLAAAAEFGCDSYPDYHNLLARKDIDVVVNAAPSHLHVPMSLKLLQNGFHVVCEKPLAENVAGVEKLMEASGTSGRLLLAFHNMRYVSYSRQVKKVLDSGVLGRIVQISIADSSFRRRWDWQTLQKYSGGNLLVLGSHALDEAICFAGLDAMPDVTCRLDRVNTFGDADDYAKLILRLQGKPLIDIEISSCNAFPPPRYHIQGARGSLTGTAEKIQWRYFRPEEAPARKLIEAPLANAMGEPVYCSEELKWHHDVWENKSVEYEFGSVEYYRALYEVLAGGAEPEVSLQQVRLQAAIIEECLRANRLDRLPD